MLARRRRCAAIVAVFVVVVLVECVLCNLPFFRTVAASGDSAAAYNTLGPGLERTKDGLLRVTDPTQAYLQVAADGSSDYVRVDPVSDGVLSRALRSRSASENVLWTVRVRPDADRRACGVSSVSLSSPRSLYVKAVAGRTVRLQILEPKGSLIPFEAVRANVRVPFSLSPLRIVAMLLLFALVALWRPGSRLWKVPVDMSRRRQRIVLALVLAVPAAATLAGVVWQLANAVPLRFHSDGMYTYDFDQYDHVAQSLLHGRLWLDLDVPDALSGVSDPYDVATRQRLLHSGVQPIYWDYAFFHGHWYSYFGVVPAVLLFVPYRLVTSLWVDGGLALPTGAAVLLLMFGFLVFSCLLTVRLAVRLRPGVSVAATGMLCAFVLLASNGAYLWYRTNFYSVPIAASLMLSTLGLWLWLGASMPRKSRSGGPADPGACMSDDGVPALSLPHLAAGSVCIAANLGCRPPFVLVALLAFPMFWPQIRSIIRRLSASRRAGTDTSGIGTVARVGVLRLLRAPLAVVIPALVVVVPLFAYNAARFGSPLDFGSAYQMTVTDLTSYRQPASNLVMTVVYYLFLPLRFTSTFPFLAVSPSPLPSWGFAEAMPGGLLPMVPLAAAAFALPFLRRRMRACGDANLWHTLMGCLLLGLLVVVLDARLAGLGWRYMADFGWLFALAAMPAPLTMLDCRGVRLRWLARAAFLALLVFGIVVMVMSLFMFGRDDEMFRNNAPLFHEVQSWFALL
ncbi:MAG TPA: hypothetical protein DCO66_03705 [Bifidobacterium sp.]|nr:hypothetical protein [Bifidobacterium sp.]